MDPVAGVVAGRWSVISRPVSGARLQPACGRDQRRGGLFKAIFGSARCQQTQVRRPISPAADPLLELETSLREVRSLKFHNHHIESTRVFSWLKALSHLRHFKDIMLNRHQSMVSEIGSTIKRFRDLNFMSIHYCVLMPI